MNARAIMRTFKNAALILMIGDLLLAIMQTETVLRMGNPALATRILILLMLSTGAMFLLTGIAVTAANKQLQCGKHHHP